MSVKKQKLELDVEQQTSSKSGKEYIKAVYCHLAYLTYMQSTYNLYAETVTDLILGALKSLQIVTAAMKLKDACSLEEKL